MYIILIFFESVNSVKSVESIVSVLSVLSVVSVASVESVELVKKPSRIYLPGCWGTWHSWRLSCDPSARSAPSSGAYTQSHHYIIFNLHGISSYGSISVRQLWWSTERKIILGHPVPEVVVVDTMICWSKGQVVRRTRVEFDTADICLGLTKKKQGLKWRQWN